MLRNISARGRPGSRRLIALMALAIMGLVIYFLAVDRGGEAVLGHASAVRGDVLSLEGTSYRLAGIAAPTPEMFCRRDGLDYRCGAAARDALAALIDDQPVRCVPGDTRRGGITVARCFVDGRDLAGAMVLAGHALTGETYRNEEIEARAEERGLWSGSFDEDTIRRRLP
ncbi:MAG: thermonuclease family protein [Salinarimonas sp.]|nr:thermonuclease family protein [Salinarimonas sp.]